MYVLVRVIVHNSLFIIYNQSHDLFKHSVYSGSKFCTLELSSLRQACQSKHQCRKVCFGWDQGSIRWRLWGVCFGPKARSQSEEGSANTTHFFARLDSTNAAMPDGHWGWPGECSSPFQFRLWSKSTWYSASAARYWEPLRRRSPCAIHWLGVVHFQIRQEKISRRDALWYPMSWQQKRREGANRGQQEETSWKPCFLSSPCPCAEKHDPTSRWTCHWVWETSPGWSQGNLVCQCLSCFLCNCQTLANYFNMYHWDALQVTK